MKILIVFIIIMQVLLILWGMYKLTLNDSGCGFFLIIFNSFFLALNIVNLINLAKY